MSVIDLAERRRRRDEALKPAPSASEALAEARMRITTLERTLALTARDNARNRERAERAEAVLRAAGIALPDGSSRAMP
ncbi:MAG: hypothetical protein ACFBWO_03535 [Paracoccaceae bacterium]